MSLLIIWKAVLGRCGGCDCMYPSIRELEGGGYKLFSDHIMLILQG
jgi:hypothetical protein